MDSCLPQEPFIKLDKDGKASILNYNLPQNTSYSITSFLNLQIPKDWFKPTEKNLFWLELAKKPIEEIKALVLQDIQSGGAVKIIDNAALLDRSNIAIVNVALERTKLEKQSSIERDRQTSLYAIDPVFNFEDANQEELFISNPITPQLTTNPISPSTGQTVHIATPLKRAYIPVDYVASMIKDGFRPILEVNPLGDKILTRFIDTKKQTFEIPELMIALEMKMSSFLGDYGAGKTIKTFSLLPGERTTISIRTYQQEQTTRLQAQNILDSYSESSAEDLQKALQNEVGHAINMSEQEVSTKTNNWKAGGGFGLNLGIFKIGGGGGGGGTGSSTSTISNAIQTQVNMLSSATSHHVSKSDSLRQIEINTETTSSSLSEYEETTVRELENINKSRVLNFVFRQLLQEYISITHLVDVSFVYYGGLGNRKSCRMMGLDELLEEVLKDKETVEKTKQMIYTQLCSIQNHENKTVSLIEKVTEKMSNCIDPNFEGETVEYVKVRKDLEQTYKDKKVQGIILNTSERILRTPSLIVDALLGQGESLDCYNQKLQDAATQNAALQNQRLEQAIKVIDTINVPEERAKLYKKVFTECCDVPQSGGCGCSDRKME
ncbi:hypothetical protein [Myroides sp. DW712]|uniref:hypothetical protein n=1 Tax=Myroides sp. DW712 TaxID=3389800 RepID=UPI0039794CF6